MTQTAAEESPLSVCHCPYLHMLIPILTITCTICNNVLKDDGGKLSTRQWANVVSVLINERTSDGKVGFEYSKLNWCCFPPKCSSNTMSSNRQTQNPYEVFPSSLKMGLCKISNSSAFSLALGTCCFQLTASQHATLPANQDFLLYCSVAK